MYTFLRDKWNMFAKFQLKYEQIFFFAKMTPSKEELPPQPLRDEDNYDISNIRSDEDTDDEDHPRKVVPRWASGIEFRTLLLRQAFLPPDLDAIFSDVGHIGKIPFICQRVFTFCNGNRIIEKKSKCFFF